MRFGNKPVECIARMASMKDIQPYRIRYEDSEGKHVIKIDKYVVRDMEEGKSNMWNGKTTKIRYKCSSIINGMNYIFELLFDTSTCKWYLL